MTLSWLIFACCLLILAFISIGLLRLTLIVVTVRGQSMSPTFEEGDQVFVCRFWPKQRLRHGHIVIVRQSRERMKGHIPFIKRIVGLPGVTVTTSIDDVPEHFCSSVLVEHDQQGQRTWYIPAGHIFVRGDARCGSIDSIVWGPIPFQQVEGIVIRKLSHQNSSPQPKTVHRSQEGPRVGQSTPFFTAKTLSGEIVTQRTYVDRSVVFLFVLPSQLCREAIPGYEALAPQAAQAGVELVLVSNAYTTKTHTFITELSSTLPILIAPRESNRFFRDYKISSIPFFCLVDAQGIVQATGFPTLEWGQWKMLAERWKQVASRGEAETVASYAMKEHAENKVTRAKEHEQTFQQVSD